MFSPLDRVVVPIPTRPWYTASQKVSEVRSSVHMEGSTEAPPSLNATLTTLEELDDAEEVDEVSEVKEVDEADEMIEEVDEELDEEVDEELDEEPDEVPATSYAAIPAITIITIIATATIARETPERLSSG